MTGQMEPNREQRKASMFNMRGLLSASRVSSWLLLIGVATSLVTGIALMRPDLFGAQYSIIEKIHIFAPLIFAPLLLIHLLAGLFMSASRKPNTAKTIIAVQTVLIFVLGIVVYLALWGGTTSPILSTSEPVTVGEFSGEHVGVASLPSAQQPAVEQTTSTTTAGKQQQATPGNMSVTLTRDMVAKHNRADDCWIIVNGKVYDVTPYLPLHPAGARIIVPFCGKDATRVFMNTHSMRAYRLLERFYIGSLGDRISAVDVSAPRNGTTTTTSIPAVPIPAAPLGPQTSGSSPMGDPISSVLSVFPGAEIVKVEHEGGYLYEVKLVYGGVPYEVKVDVDGNILKVEGGKAKKKAEMGWEGEEWEDD